MATKAAPWLKPRTPSKGPWSLTASLTAITLSSSPRLSSHCCWALKLRAWTSENHHPLGSSSPPGPGAESFSLSGRSKSPEEGSYSAVFHHLQFHRSQSKRAMKSLSFYNHLCSCCSCFSLMNWQLGGNGSNIRIIVLRQTPHDREIIKLEFWPGLIEQHLSSGRLNDLVYCHKLHSWWLPVIIKTRHMSQVLQKQNYKCFLLIMWLL